MSTLENGIRPLLMGNEGGVNLTALRSFSDIMYPPNFINSVSSNLIFSTDSGGEGEAEDALLYNTLNKYPIILLYIIHVSFY
jgi:hypothetical protein